MECMAWNGPSKGALRLADGGVLADTIQSSNFLTRHHIVHLVVRISHLRDAYQSIASRIIDGRNVPGRQFGGLVARFCV